MDGPGRNLKIAVLASGGATDMGPIADQIEKGQLSAKIVALICDNPEAYAFKRAEKYGIPTVLIELRDKTDKTRKDFDKEIMRAVKKYNPDLILLLGWMKILGPEFVQEHGGLKTWNIHPALLPMFAGGMDRSVHKDVLERGAKITGCSLIALDEGADTGPIILEKIVEVKFGDTIDTLRDRVQKAEQEIILEAIRLHIEGRLKIVTNAYGGQWVKILDEPDSGNTMMTDL